MNHRIISVLIGFVIIAAVVGGVVYLEFPKMSPREERPQTISTSTVDLLKRATTSVFGSLLRPVVGPPPAAAVPTVTWTPSSVTEAILPGEAKTVSVSFTASETVSNVEVRVVPELLPFILMSPPAFASIVRGQVIGVSLSFSAPVGSAIAKLDGTLQLRSAIDPDRTLSRPLPITLHVGRVFVDPVAGYEITYDSRFGISDLQSTRPAFVGGKLFSIPGDMPNLAVAIYENPSGLPVEDWYAMTLADREYTFADAGSRSTASPVVAGTLSLQIRSEVLGYVQLRTFVPSGDKVFGLETTVPDDVSVPESYFQMLATFSFVR